MLGPQGEAAEASQQRRQRDQGCAHNAAFTPSLRISAEGYTAKRV